MKIDFTMKTSLSIAAAALLAFGVFYLWQSYPTRLVERLTGLDLPASTKVLHVEKNWPGNGVDGYSIWTLEVSEEFRDQTFSQCRSIGYRLGKFSISDLGIHSNDSIDAIIGSPGDSCFKITTNPGDLELFLLSDVRLIVLVSSI